MNSNWLVLWKMSPLQQGVHGLAEGEKKKPCLQVTSTNEWHKLSEGVYVYSCAQINHILTDEIKW